MISVKLLLYCMLWGGVYLAVITLILGILERTFGFSRGIPEPLKEKTGPLFSVINYMMEAMFYVMIPAVAYSFFYLVIPLTGVRAGIGTALFAFALGSVPVVMSLSVHIKLPMPYLLWTLLSQFLKLGGSFAIIAYLYEL